MNANEILKIVRGLRVAMSLADAVPTEAHKHEGDLKWFGEVVNVHGGYDAIRDGLETARGLQAPDQMQADLDAYERLCQLKDARIAELESSATALLTLCDQLEAMKHTMFLRPGTGQHYSYLVREDVYTYVEQARAALTRTTKKETK